MKDTHTGDLFSQRPPTKPPKPPKTSNGQEDDDDYSGESRADQIFRRFVAFFKANPHVWELFQQYTKEAIRRGFEHYGAGGIYERMRWHVNMETVSEDGLKLSNDFRAYYARCFHIEYPQHNGFFRNRKLRSEDAPAFKHDTSFINTELPSVKEDRLLEKLAELLRQNRRDK